MKLGDIGNGNGRAPDFIVKVGLKGEPYHKRVGAGWRTKDGKGLSIKLDAGIALVSGTDVSITLWKNEERPQATQTPNHLQDDNDQIPY